MARPKTSFLCRQCGSSFPRWLGRCSDCGGWDTLEEQRTDASASRDPQRGSVGGPTGQGATARPLNEVFESGGDTVPRMPTGIGELDRVLGGDASARGLVPGSVVLVGGEPGIGKSTLMLQAAGALAAKGSRVLYVSSEESSAQVGQRAARLGVGASAAGNKSDAVDAAGSSLFLLADTNLARIIEQVRRVAPAVVVLDSVQMVYKGDLDAAPGSIAQLRRCAAELVFLAKGAGEERDGPAVLLVGHVTKEGQLAGPRLLEHLVDTVISFEGDRHHAHRLVRAVKNRFGTTQELGIFEMTGRGLEELPEGASVAAAEHAGPRPGAVVCPIISGSRCVLAEVQALTATGFLGAAKRKSSGLDSNRLAMLIAVLEQHAELRLADRDVFAQSVGGIRVSEPAGDLALALAIAGSHLRRALDPKMIVVGEVGLGGEVRAVPQLEMRLREAARLGYTHALVPASAIAGGASGRGGSGRIGNSRGGSGALRKATGLEPVGVGTVSAAIELLG